MTKVTLNPLHSEELQLLTTASDLTPTLDTRYLKLTGDNDPITGNIIINTPSTTALVVEDSGTKDDVLVVDTVNAKVTVNSGTTGQSIIGTGLIINNDSGSNAINDFKVKTNVYNAITVDASNDDLLLMSNASGKVAFFGGTPSVQSTGWAVSNVTPDKVYDADSTTLDELADVLGSLLTELLSKGLIGA